MPGFSTLLSSTLAFLLGLVLFVALVRLGSSLLERKLLDEADLRCDARLALAASIRRRGKRRAIREGDENTRFFHAAASHWRRRSTIRTLEVEVVLVVDHARKAAALLDYCSGQLGRCRRPVYRFVLAALYANARLVLGPPQLAPIEPDEVKAVVVALDDRTSEPSHDGLGPAFYQAAWGWWLPTSNASSTSSMLAPSSLRGSTGHTSPFFRKGLAFHLRLPSGWPPCRMATSRSYAED
ncbi:hypothetical protein D1007_30198 [Hordeum vulgare]|nr:hypothetical protein D1007_30198 [Hordeum vulgare]